MTSETPTRSTRNLVVEILAALLLSLAAVGTAWSGYQVNRWNGAQVIAGSRTNALRIEAARAQGLSQAETQVDVATFIQWVNAYATGDVRLQDFYAARFRPDFRVAFDAWIATQPLANPSAPPTPFALPEYQRTKKDAARLDDAAAASAEVVQRDLQRSADYMLAVVLFAVTLFFAGISARFTSPRLRLVLLTVGVVVFLGTVVWLTTFPVLVSL